MCFEDSLRGREAREKTTGAKRRARNKGGPIPMNSYTYDLRSYWKKKKGDFIEMIQKYSTYIHEVSYFGASNFRFCYFKSWINPNSFFFFFSSHAESILLTIRIQSRLLKALKHIHSMVSADNCTVLQHVRPDFITPRISDRQSDGHPDSRKPSQTSISPGIKPSSHWNDILWSSSKLLRWYRLHSPAPRITISNLTLRTWCRERWLNDCQGSAIESSAAERSHRAKTLPELPLI